MSSYLSTLGCLSINECVIDYFDVGGCSLWYDCTQLCEVLCLEAFPGKSILCLEAFPGKYTVRMQSVGSTPIYIKIDGEHSVQ